MVSMANTWTMTEQLVTDRRRALESAAVGHRLTSTMRRIHEPRWHGHRQAPLARPVARLAHHPV
jgi:hypothetical protein